MTFLVGPIYKGLVAHPTSKWFFSCAHFLMTFLVGPIDKGLIAHPAGFSPVCIFTWHFRISCHTSCRQRAFLLCLSLPDISGRSAWKRSRCTSHIQMVFLLCTFSHDVSGRSDWQRSCRTSCRLFSCVSHYLTFHNFSSHILQAKGFSPAMCIFFWHFRMSCGTSCRKRAFLLCVPSPNISKCLIATLAGIGLFSCVYLLMMFQNVLLHILQAKGFSPLCIFA